MSIEELVAALVEAVAIEANAAVGEFARNPEAKLSVGGVALSIGNAKSGVANPTQLAAQIVAATGPNPHE